MVASAVGDPSPLRSAWDNFDVTTPSGIRVEVKSSAYLQSWNQRRVSAIVFSGLTGRSWSNESAGYSDERELRADVYVFAIHTCRQPDQYDPLNLRYWQFRVAGAAALREHGAPLPEPAASKSGGTPSKIMGGFAHTPRWVSAHFRHFA